MSKESAVKLLISLIVLCAVLAVASAWAPSNEASRELFGTSLALFGSGVTTLFVILAKRF